MKEFTIAKTFKNSDVATYGLGRLSVINVLEELGWWLCLIVGWRNNRSQGYVQTGAGSEKVRINFGAVLTVSGRRIGYSNRYAR